MKPIHDPFSRDAHPDLTAEILKIVNEDLQTPAREREMGKRIRTAEKRYDAAAQNYNKKIFGGKAAARAAGRKWDTAGKKLEKEYTKDETERRARKTYGAGGKVLKREGVQEAAQEVSEDIQTPERAEQQRKRIKRAERDLRQLQKIDKREKEDPKTIWGVSEPRHIRGHDENYPRKSKRVRTPPVSEAVTPAQKKVFDRERERMLTALNDPNKKLAPTEREAVIARGERSAAAEARKGAVSPTGVKGPEHAGAVRYHNYARKESKKLDAILKRKGKAVKESAEQIDERIVDEADFFQASKNWIKGKGFKTNREVIYDRVNKNYAAMKARQAAEAKSKGKTK